MTDDTVLSLIQRYVLEPVVDGGRTWASGLWDREEVLGYLGDVEREFLRHTAVGRGWQQVDYGPAQPTVVLPHEVQQILHADADQAGRSTPVVIVSRHEADQLLPAWVRTQDRPYALLVQDQGTSQVTLVPPAAAGGTLHLIVVPAPQTYSGLGDPLLVGDLWVPFLVQGVLARMFGKPGPAYNASRQATGAAFFTLGVQIAGRLHPQE